jgi:hypothetical protein
MDQSEILQQVQSARQRVAQSITQMETTLGDVDALGARAAARREQLQNNFTGYLTHLSGELGRAGQSLDELVSAVAEHDNWLRSETAARSEEARDVGHDFSESSSASQAAGDGLETHQETVGARSQSVRTLYAEVERGAQEQHQSHANALTEMGSTVQDWSTTTRTDEGEQRQHVQGQVDGPMADGRQSFFDRLSAAVEATKAALEENRTALNTRAEQEVDTLTREETATRKDLTADIEAMSKALADLGDLVADTSETMVRAAEDASDLMNMTGVGVNTVIGLIDNLKEIFDEIESAWS